LVSLIPAGGLKAVFGHLSDVLPFVEPFMSIKKLVPLAEKN
jgi:hypothetical protein